MIIVPASSSSLPAISPGEGTGHYHDHVRELLGSLTQWARDVGRWWWAVVGVVLGGVAIVTATEQLHRYLPWVIVAALVIALAGSFLAYHQERQNRLAAAAPQPEEPPPASTPVITDQWRVISNGFEIGALMHMGDMTFSHPGYRRQPDDRPPSVRVGALVACDPLGATPGSTELRQQFLRFLNRQLFMDPISGLTDTGTDKSWRPMAGLGRWMLEAFLGGDDPNEAPVVSAKLMLPEAGMTHSGSDPKCAELLVLIEPQAMGGKPALPAGLAAWQSRFAQALALPTALARFLEHDLSLATWGDPAAKFGVLVDTPGPLTELVDMGDCEPLPGAQVSNQFIGWAVADSAGASSMGTARTLMMELCDHALHLDGFEPLLPSAG